MDENVETDAVEQDMLDGNALAGTLATVFSLDATAVPAKCTKCGVVTMIGELRAYVRGPGSVLRCPACGEVILRVVEAGDGTYVDARGAAYLRFERR